MPLVSDLLLASIHAVDVTHRHTGSKTKRPVRRLICYHRRVDRMFAFLRADTFLERKEGRALRLSENTFLGHMALKEINHSS